MIYFGVCRAFGTRAEAYLEAVLLDTQMLTAPLGDVYLSSGEDAFQVGNFWFQSCLLYFSLKSVCVCLRPRCV